MFVLDSFGTEADEAAGLIELFPPFYADLGFQFLFGKGVALTAVDVVSKMTGFFDAGTFEIDLGDETQRVLPPQVAVAVTGRSNEIGRRVTMYVPGIGENALDDFGRLKDGIGVQTLQFWYDVKFGPTASYQPCMFDRNEVLPTLLIDKWRMSPAFRSQRRRVLDQTVPLTTVYMPTN